MCDLSYPCSVPSHIYYSGTENSGLSRLFTSNPFSKMCIGVQLLISSLGNNLMIGNVNVLT